jgi:multiple sugar transport system substrate-binding protein
MTLEFPSWQANEPGSSDWWKQLIAAFQAAHPNVTIDFTFVPFANYSTTLTTEFAANTPPDIVHLPLANYGPFAKQGWLEPLDSYLQGTDILQNWTKLEDSMTWNGQHVAVLLLGYGIVLYYNKQLLANAGVSVPTTPEQLLAAAKAATNASNGTYGFGVATTQEVSANYADLSTFVYGEGGAWVMDKQWAFTNPVVVKAVDDYRSAAKYSQKGITGEQKFTLFNNGKIAMMLSGTYFWSQTSGAPKAVLPNLAYAAPPFPSIPGTVSNGLSIAAKESPEKKQVVWEFIKLACSQEWQTKYALLVKAPPPRTGAVTADVLQTEPELKLFADLTSRATNYSYVSESVTGNFGVFSQLVANAALQLQTTDTPTVVILSDLQAEVSSQFQP